MQLGAQSVAWRKSDLDRWIASRPVAEAKARIGRTREQATADDYGQRKTSKMK